MLRQRSVIRSMTWDVWIILSSQIHSKVKNINYWYLLILKKFVTLFRRCCQSRSRAYFKGFLIQNQKKFCWTKNFLPQPQYPFFSYLWVTVSLDISRFVYEHVVNAFVYHEFDLTWRLDLFWHLRITKTITSKATFCLFVK